MLTDIVGYTRLAEKEPKKALAVLDEHNKLVDECVRKHSGIVARVLGDAYLVEFYSAIDAVRCALDIQVRLGARNVGLPEDKRILLRIGLHYATVKPVGQELRGEGIRLLPKVEARAAPGSVCLTEDVYDRIK